MGNSPVDAQALIAGPKSGGQGPVAPGGRGGISKSPLPTIVLGLGMTMAWIILTFVDLEATEAFYTHAKVTSFTPEWSLVLQLPEILFGKNMPIADAQAAIVGWVLLLSTLVCVMGYDLARDAVRQANHRLEKIFGYGIIVLAAGDFLANLFFGPGGASPVGQFIFAVVVTFAGFFFGVPGFRLLEHGLKTWWKH